MLLSAPPFILLLDGTRLLFRKPSRKRHVFFTALLSRASSASLAGQAGRLSFRFGYHCGFKASLFEVKAPG